VQVLKQPRFWLVTWSLIGAAALVYFIVASSVQPRDSNSPSALNHDHSLLVGEMADFSYAFPPRGSPEIAFNHGSKRVSLKDFRGKAILVNFWATWCAPCLKELPSLEALEARLGGRDFEVVAIAADPRGPEVARDFLDRLNITNLKLYTDPRLIFATSIGGTDVLPVSILYDARGNEIGRLIGEADWTSPEALRLVESAIR